MTSQSLVSLVRSHQARFLKVIEQVAASPALTRQVHPSNDLVSRSQLPAACPGQSDVLSHRDPAALSYLVRTRTSRVICYLDYDGVLHADAVYRHPRRGIYMDPAIAAHHSLFEHAGLLADALDPYPAVRIVLSTSWVRVLGYSRARAFLPKRLDSRVIGATFHSAVHGRPHHLRRHFESMPRGEQVWADVTRRRPMEWFAIDDAVDDWPDRLRPNLVPCHSHIGLGDEATQRALAQMLQAVHEPR